MELKFKVGDKVRGIGADIKGCEGIIEEVKPDGYNIRFTKVGNEAWHGIGEWRVGNLMCRHTFWEGSLELITSSDETNKRRTFKMKLNTMMKKLLDKDTKILIEADYIDGNLLLTEEGKRALDAIIFEEYKADLVKLAKEKIEEIKENK